MFLLLLALSTLATTLGAPTSSSRYIITFHENSVDPSSRLSWLSNVTSISTKSLDSSSTVDWDVSLLDGIATSLNAQDVDSIRARKEVKLVEPDMVMRKSQGLIRQTNAPWGLSRLSSASPIQLSNGLRDVSTGFDYIFNLNSTGQGVNVYVLDTGLLVSHKDFGGRATFLASFDGAENVDLDGHGTHVSGTVAGSLFGVAKSSKVFAIKVLGDDGTGATSSIISGLSAVRSHRAQLGNPPSVVNLSLGGLHVEALDNAVRSLISSGVSVVVAAGNEGRAVGFDSPADVEEAITVGSTSISDSISAFSNFGDKVDIYAPGQRIISLSNVGDEQTRVLSGTSMSTPHVSGIVACLLSQNPTMSPAQVKEAVLKLGRTGVLRGANGNLLAGNGL